MALRDEYWGVVINPYAGTKKLKKDRVNIFRLMKRAEIRFLEQTTEYAGHAIEIAKSMVDSGITHLLVVGGDGTLNEIVNGIYQSSVVDKSTISIAVIPYGTGNDWARYWGLLADRRDISEKLFNRNRVLVDVGRVEYYDEGNLKTHYMLNASGFGFDGQVVKITNYLKQFLGGNSWTYSLAILLSVFKYRPTKMNLKGGDKNFDGSVFTVAVGNSCFSGGGLKQVPKANPTDGVFHITAIEKPTFLKIILGLKDLFTGNFDNHPCAHNFVSNRFTLELEKELPFEIDGVLMPPTNKVIIETIHKGLGMYV